MSRSLSKVVNTTATTHCYGARLISSNFSSSVNRASSTFTTSSPSSSFTTSSSTSLSSTLLKNHHTICNNISSNRIQPSSLMINSYSHRQRYNFNLSTKTTSNQRYNYSSSSNTNQQQQNNNNNLTTKNIDNNGQEKNHDRFYNQEDITDRLNNHFNRKQQRRILFASGGSLLLISSIGIVGGNNNNSNNEGGMFSNLQIKESWKVLGTIIAINGIIYLLLQNPAFFAKYGSHFLCSVSNVTSHPLCLVLSNFSHLQPLHFLFNMVGLWSFGQSAHDYMGTLPFLALYMGGGMVGSMSSIIQKLIVRDFGIPSIGASGCILSVVAASIMFEPTNRVSLIFFPFASFESQYVLWALMAFDALGIAFLSRWTGWDHSCHLGSMIAGVAIADSYRYKARFQHFTGTGKTWVKDKFTYEGSFKDGAMDGRGALHRIPENDVYKGTFVDNQFVRGLLVRNGETFNVERR
ncbi:hypothetical protein DFA_08225 [Cavenderia fasciculata]|uniref:Peptidase S54 rhomboid domain-containing protein n=1 Tax=Cavenderia fasciculata TaxID=261658 RepID=F4Q5H6_CACFS|nr:uncharacterized protein DFA_08225 [Cavenderia fasciculata]EGG17235.1 hypothetical protein DFA_08225 [Cavenderia fasciculata]|eukprot:XP_004355719.1 hypothetical protein DFA_08225 [Cavenderia fasciculata]